MPEQPITKSELLADMERDWTTLNTTLDRLTETQLTSPTDAQGWTVKDHLMHLVAWEQSVVGLLHGQPRHVALGVDEALVPAGDEDAINAAIQHQNVDVPLIEVLAQLRQTHQQLLAALQPLSDAALHLPYRHYLPGEPADGDGPPTIDVIANNSARHFAEHLPWIEALVNSASIGASPMPIIIRPETPADFARVYEITEAAFRDLPISDHTEQHLVNRLRTSTAYIPELALVAELDGEVVGHILFTRAAIVGLDREWESLTLAPVSVAPDHQRQGIGGRLIRAGIQIARELGYDSINLVGHAEYYPRFGFVPASRYGVRCAFDVPDDVSMLLELKPGALNGVSGVVRYAPEFNLG